MDWTEWSRQAVQTMFAHNAAWRQAFGLAEGAPLRWDLPTATLAFEADGQDVVATVCLVGTTSDAGGSFLWSWANEAIPAQHGEALAVVREFGQAHGLALLTTPEITGGRPEALECMCIAGRLQRAVGTFSDQVGDVGLYFTILHIQARGHGAEPSI